MATQTLADLNTAFGNRPGIRFESGPGGLIRAVLSADAADAQLYLHGAHLAHFQRKGQRPVLFMSAKSAFEHDKPIRGGVPICWPWFGQSGTPMHGFARLCQWTVESAQKNADGSVSMTLSLASNDQTRAMWPHEFLVRFTVCISSILEMSLETTNRSPAAFAFQEALHTYFAVSDVRGVQVLGLENATYVDKFHDLKPTQRDNTPLRFTSEHDANYPNNQATCVIDDPGWKRKIRVEKHNSNTTVVWNPWINKAKAMPDFGDDEWLDMLCIETANTGAYRVELPPGQSHTLRAVIRVEPLPAR